MCEWIIATSLLCLHLLLLTFFRSSFRTLEGRKEVSGLWACGRLPWHGIMEQRWKELGGLSQTKDYWLTGAGWADRDKSKGA